MFNPVTLAKLSLRIQLGHVPESCCANPHPASQGFTIIHTNGLHHVNIDYCECDNAGSAGSHRQQLLQRCWFFATHIEPQSCGTFSILTQFHMLNLQGKIAKYNYYSRLEKLTGLSKIKVSRHCSSSHDACLLRLHVQDRYNAFMHMVCKWQHLKMLK
jgi:hypothetical protein